MTAVTPRPDTAALRRVAEAATQRSGDAIKDRHANAAHIAAFDPPTTLALIAEVETLRARLAAVGALAEPVRADRVPASLTAAQGYVGVRCGKCNAPPGRQCWNRDMGQTGPHAKRREHAGVAAWWHCFGETP